MIRSGSLMFVILGAGSAIAGQLSVSTVSPARNSLGNSVAPQIQITFNMPVNPATVTSSSARVFGRLSGAIPGTWWVSPDGLTVGFTPHRVFGANDLVTVNLSHDIAATDGSPLRAAGYAWQFWVRTRNAPPAFVQIDQLSTNAGAESSRPYGGSPTDLNGDGWVDLPLVNEDSNDLRVFMNTADGSGMYDDFLQPTAPLSGVPSPSESADFNNDGLTDFCVTNTGSTDISVLLGNGDGTFGPQQTVIMGSQPVGLVAMDVDGDGDTDLVSANEASSNMGVALNNGAGVFGAATNFEGGGSNERGMAAADMDGDGIMDLVVGTYGNQRMNVLRGNGNGTFTLLNSVNAGGQVWMVVTGDIDGDGDADVASGNSSQNRAAIFYNNGAGLLSAPTLLTTDPFCIAVDFGDLDGDDDLDLVTSSFSGDWRIFRNNGGAFAFLQEIPAPSNSSCALMLDIDNDGDCDLALIDEIADTMDIYKNDGTAPCPTDLDNDEQTGQSDLAVLLSVYLTCPGNVNYNAAAGSISSDGDPCVTLSDLAGLLAAYGDACP